MENEIIDKPNLFEKVLNFATKTKKFRNSYNNFNFIRNNLFRLS